MCHSETLEFFPAASEARPYEGPVSGLVYGEQNAGRKIAVFPDIYGMTPFYKRFSSYLAAWGAEVFLVNPWQPFGELPEQTRDAAYARRHKLKEQTFCNDLNDFVRQERIDAVIGFCIGGNFVLELVRQGYKGAACAVYPLPWGMPNQDALQPAFEYMPQINAKVAILMGEEDALAGPDNIARLRKICHANPLLELHLYQKSGHGFFTDLESADHDLQKNALDGLRVIMNTVGFTDLPSDAYDAADLQREVIMNTVNFKDDQPWLLGNHEAREARRKELDKPHIKPLTQFVKDLHKKTDRGERDIPYFDPWDGGVNAEVLYLLQAPGPGAVESEGGSGFISCNNPDETAQNCFELDKEAGIERQRILRWNIIPWRIDGQPRDKDAEIEALTELLQLLQKEKELRAIVLQGGEAQKGWKRAQRKWGQQNNNQIMEFASNLKIFECPLPSPRNFNCNRRLFPREKLLQCLKDVKAFLDS